jgi:hypothetical protein
MVSVEVEKSIALMIVFGDTFMVSSFCPKAIRVNKNELEPEFKQERGAKEKEMQKDERQLVIWMVNDTGIANRHPIIVQARCHPQSKGTPSVGGRPTFQALQRPFPWLFIYPDRPSTLG